MEEKKEKSFLDKISILEMEQKINEYEKIVVEEIEAALKENVSTRSKLSFIKNKILLAEHKLTFLSSSSTAISAA